MPYIKYPARRKYSAKNIAVFSEPGQLNFAFTDLINLYIKDKGLNYSTINDVIGALEGCKLEFYRRIAVPYENGKISENGDVFTLNQDVYKTEVDKNGNA